MYFLIIFKKNNYFKKETSIDENFQFDFLLRNSFNLQTIIIQPNQIKQKFNHIQKSPTR